MRESREEAVLSVTEKRKKKRERCIKGIKGKKLMEEESKEEEMQAEGFG